MRYIEDGEFDVLFVDRGIPEGEDDDVEEEITCDVNAEGRLRPFIKQLAGAVRGYSAVYGGY